MEEHFGDANDVGAWNDSLLGFTISAVSLLATNTIPKTFSDFYTLRASSFSSAIYETASSQSSVILCLLVLTPALLLAQAALAEHRHLYVDAAAQENGDGSREHPFWRITDGVVAARALRQHHHHQRITLRVLPGTYVGSFDGGHLAGDPRLEMLPIILNVSNLSLEGATELDEDVDGLPTGTYPPESETLLTIEVCQLPCPLVRGQSLLLIAGTNDGMAGDRVSVSGFVIDGRSEGIMSAVGFGIFADRVADFSIHHNLLRHGGGGFASRMASGTLEANVCPNNNNIGFFVSGGNLAHPANVTLQRNRSTQNAGGASLFAVANFVPLVLGANPLMLEPLQLIYDRNNPEDVRNMPDQLEATVEGNDFSENHLLIATGLRCTFYPPIHYTTIDATQPITGTLNVNVRDNRLSRNGDHGITIDAGFSNRSDPRQLTGRFEGRFESNELIDNGRNTSLMGFTNRDASVGLGSRQDYKYMQESTCQVADLDGELEGFDYDHPLTDPFDGSPVVSNVLIVNGGVQPNGIRISPRH